MKIATKRKRIEKKLEAAHKELRALRKECQHENAKYKYGSNTGNWCPVDDCYWVEWNCPDCGMCWTTEGSSLDNKYNIPGYLTEV